MSITGFAHKGRGVGVRDHQLILPSVVCSTHVSRKIANEVGAITFAHQNGCGIIGIDMKQVWCRQKSFEITLRVRKQF